MKNIKMHFQRVNQITEQPPIPRQIKLVYQEMEPILRNIGMKGSENWKPISTISTAIVSLAIPSNGLMSLYEGRLELRI